MWAGSFIFKLRRGLDVPVGGRRKGDEAIANLAKLGVDFEYLGTEEFTKFWRKDYQIYKDRAKLFKK